MVESITFSQLPEEILEVIYSCNCLCAADILRLGETCHRFQSVVHSNELWRKKFLQRWPKLPVTQTHQAYQDVYKRYYRLEHDLLTILQDIANESYALDDVPKCVFEKVHPLFEDLSFMDVVLYLLRKYSRESLVGGDLNIRYYAEKVYKYTYQHHLKWKWKEILTQTNPPKENLEKGAVLISQWCSNSNVEGDAVYKQLDDIADQVKEQLGVCPIDNKTYDEVMNVISIINKVLYKDFGFKANRGFYYNIHNSFIEQVLLTKKGIPISLSVIYMAIARRIGLDIRGINFPGHFLMQVPVMKSGSLTKFYVDAFDEGRVMDEETCLQGLIYYPPEVPREILFQVAEERNIFIRMVGNIINILRQHTSMDSRNLDSLKSALELMLLLAPDDEENNLLLSRIYLHYGINLEEVIVTLQRVFASNRSARSHGLESLLQHAEERKNDRKNMQIKYRTSDENVSVRYRIGMVMKHKRYHYYCVIFGWDPFCKMDKSWQQQMGVQNLPNKDKQPFYSVLVHDGTTRYASEENLDRVMVGRPIQHPEVGKHFKLFDGYHYIATSMLRKYYPEDQPIPPAELPEEAFAASSDT